MSHEPFDDWAALAALGALDGQERQRFDAHLAAGCAPCEERLRELSAVLATLPLALPDAPVPPHLKERLLQRVAAERKATQRPTMSRVPGSPRHPWQWAAGIVAAGIVGALAWSVYDTRSALDRQVTSLERLEGELASQRAVTALVSGTDTSAATLTGAGAAARADGWIVWSPAKQQGFIVVHNLPGLPVGKQYQLWAVAGRAPTSAGVFGVDAIGHAALLVDVRTERPEHFAVTIEPAGGAPAPTGPVVMQGSPS